MLITELFIDTSAMKEHLFIIFLLTGFIPFTLSIPRKYYLIQQGKIWSDAQTYCRATHTDLATIEDTKNMIRVQYVTQSENFNSSAWIGLSNDVKSWRWSMGNQPLGSFYTWYGTNPDNWKGKETCGAIAPWGWLDCPCPNLYPFVCYDATKSTGQYIYYSSLKNWSDAQSYCRQYHTDLASAKTSTENSIIKAMIKANTWFGLFRDSWKWSDGTIFTSIPMMPGQPDNLLKNENCMALTNSEASDELCSDIKPFFCYSSITERKQIIRVKLQANSDVNDPSLKEAVLNKIWQKLSVYWNITVKWRGIRRIGV
ncbi:C-type mannose receptor 2-like [Silurus meridionalis]|uniref:C-type mannose receptor 2-like n=1 Tax=Silurus meridionalis TaxID=175797 RepID=UPI001EEAD949|nr:C-type mannose receptor 2-like [Silurus meridionalis]